LFQKNLKEKKTKQEGEVVEEENMVI